MYPQALRLFVLLASFVLYGRPASAQSRVAAEDAVAPSPHAEAAKRQETRERSADAPPAGTAGRAQEPGSDEGEAEPSSAPKKSSAMTAEERAAAASAARRERRHQRRAAEAEAAKLAAAAEPVPSEEKKPERAKAERAKVEIPSDEKPAKPERTKAERAKIEPPKRRGKVARHGRQPNAEYRRLRDQWHAPVADPVIAAAIVDTSGRVPLTILPVNGGAQVSLVPEREDGGFSDADLEVAARAFAPKDMRHTHPISPHLLDLVYRTMRHFSAPLVRLVSGYRPDRAGSRHTQGRAIDMVVPGVTNEALAEYVRQFGFCGVGIYPKSGFVHLDVRDASFFWVDQSLPDERSRSEPILPLESAAADRAARARGEAPDTFVPGNQREDRAAARTYAKRAQKRRSSAERMAAERAAPERADNSGE